MGTYGIVSGLQLTVKVGKVSVRGVHAGFGYVVQEGYAPRVKEYFHGAQLYDAPGGENTTANGRFQSETVQPTSHFVNIF